MSALVGSKVGSYHQSLINQFTMKTIVRWGGIFIAIYLVVLVIATIAGGIRPVDMQWVVPGWYDLIRPWAVVPYATSGITVVNTLIIITQAATAFIFGLIAGVISLFLKNLR